MKYTPNPAGVRAYLTQSPELKAELRRRAQIGLAVGRALAPRRSGTLASSGRVVDDGIGGAKRDRMQLSVLFDAEHAAAVTFGYRRRPGGHRAYLEAVKAVIEAGS